MLTAFREFKDKFVCSFISQQGECVGNGDALHGKQCPNDTQLKPWTLMSW